MLTRKTMDILTSLDMGYSKRDVEEMYDMISYGLNCGWLRIGIENIKLLDSVFEGYLSKRIEDKLTKYKYNGKDCIWLEEKDLIRLSTDLTEYKVVPQGHPVEIEYNNGNLVGVRGVDEEGKYSIDITNKVAEIVPSVVEVGITKVYGVLKITGYTISDRASILTTDLSELYTVLKGEQKLARHMGSVVITEVLGGNIESYVSLANKGGIRVQEMDRRKAPIEELKKELCKQSKVVLLETSEQVYVSILGGTEEGEIQSIYVESGYGSGDIVVLEVVNEDSGGARSVAKSVYSSSVHAVIGLSKGSKIKYKSLGDKGVLSDGCGIKILGADLVS